jgi:protein-disulfide isomerase
MATLKVPVTPEDHIQGNDAAPITLVEYGDYQCPYCRLAYDVVKQLQDHFGDQLKFVFRNFPLTDVHPLAELAAETAEFAADKVIFGRCMMPSTNIKIVLADHF